MIAICSGFSFAPFHFEFLVLALLLLVFFLLGNYFSCWTISLSTIQNLLYTLKNWWVFQTRERALDISTKQTFYNHVVKEMDRIVVNTQQNHIINYMFLALVLSLSLVILFICITHSCSLAHSLSFQFGSMCVLLIIKIYSLTIVITHTHTQNCWQQLFTS